jgi:hypothetical protein
MTTQQTGDIVYDGSSAPGQGLDRSAVEQFLKGKITPRMFRQVRYAEIIYRDHGSLLRTYVIRAGDGSVSPPITQALG